MSPQAARLKRLDQIKSTLGPDYADASECRDCTYARSVRADHYRKVGGDERHTTRAVCRSCNTTTVEMWSRDRLVRETRRKLTDSELRRAGAKTKTNGFGHRASCTCGCER